MRVAKDWSMTIRASQVIPVYPMTEDLQPGDLFLVRRTVEDQYKAYREKGYLPLDYQIARLQPSGYAPFYANSFFVAGTDYHMPQTWLTPGESVSFGRAPAAAFPAYSFSVKSGAGFSAALPIQGVPVALSLLGSAAGVGSVTIKDARTYGVDLASLVADVQQWNGKPENRDLLKAYAPLSNEKPGVVKPRAYLRVVSRVYLTGKLNVSLASSDAFAGGLRAGATTRPIDLPLSAPSTQPNAVTADSYQDGLRKLNQTLNAPIPEASKPPASGTTPATPATPATGVAATDGAAAAAAGAAGVVEKALPISASLQVVAATARSVSIDETFPRPVVIGYLGFDMAILDNGELGPPIPTLAVLDGKQTPPATALPLVYSVSTSRMVMSQRVAQEIVRAGLPNKDVAQALLNELEGASRPLVPARYPIAIWKINPEGTLSKQFEAGAAIGGDDSFTRLNMYRSQLEHSRGVLADPTAKSAGAASDATSNAATVAAERAADLAATVSELRRVNEQFATLYPVLRKFDALFWTN